MHGGKLIYTDGSIIIKKSGNLFSMLELLYPKLLL